MHDTHTHTHPHTPTHTHTYYNAFDPDLFIKMWLLLLQPMSRCYKTILPLRSAIKYRGIVVGFLPYFQAVSSNPESKDGNKYKEPGKGPKLFQKYGQVLRHG